MELLNKLGPLATNPKTVQQIPAHVGQDQPTKVIFKSNKKQDYFSGATLNRATPISNAKKKKGMPSLRSGINKKV